MKIVVFGAAGVLGRAVVQTLALRGHDVRGLARADVDFAAGPDAQALRPLVRGADIVVNTVGILIERGGNTWERVHTQAAAALASACEAERVARVVHVSALGVGSGIAGGYMASKLAAEQAFARHCVDYAIVRPALLVDPACDSTRLFRALAALPVIGLPGLLHPGRSLIAPIAVHDVAACIARIAEHPKALRRVIELAGPEPMTYREMLRRYRQGYGRGAALWLPLPWWLMMLTAHAATLAPQRVFSPDTVRMLRAGTQPQCNEAARWLGHAPAAIPLANAAQRGGLASIG